MVDEVSKVTNQMDAFVERLITKITLDVTANLIETTPVDTGWARANWIPKIGSPVVEDLSAITPTSQAASGAAGRQQAGLAGVAAGYRIQLGSVFISNNVPYISDLNDGTSQQQPAGFVQRAVAKAVTRDLLGIRA